MGIAGFTGITEIASDDISLSAEVSYALLQKYQRRGLAKEVLLALLSYGRKDAKRANSDSLLPESARIMLLPRLSPKNAVFKFILSDYYCTSRSEGIKDNPVMPSSAGGSSPGCFPEL